MAKLYMLAEKYNQLLQMAEEVDATTFQDTLESIEDEINEKAENIAFVLQNMKADIQVLKDEEKRLRERRKALENKVEHLRFYLLNELESVGIDKVKTAHFNISVRNTPEKVVIADEESLPESYYIIKKQVDKKTLKEALKNGEEIEGVTLQTERTVNIR